MAVGQGKERGLELTKQIGVLRNRKTLDGRKADRNKVNLEYWNFNENLGDLLAPVVTQWMLHRLGLDLYREAAKPCHLMTIGSVLGLGVFDAVIWGSGVNSFAHVGRVTTQKGYRKLDIRAVRGPVTAQVLRENGYTCPQIYGDPAILLPLIYPGRRPEKKKKYVVIDHYMKRKTTGDDRLSIRTGDYRTFLDKILEAEVVYSSSLHGIILAESYGVPSVFLRQGMEEESILPAITATLAKGISVNVTLIFSLERYEQVIDAFIEGIAQADANGHDLKHIGSVASFFVSRVDTAVDKLLEANGSDEAKALEGKAAVANARLAYELFEKKFAEDPRWADLAAKGAKVQRPLWASTGTKNAAYSDCKYVDELVAKHIVNTMPEKTLNALADHGNGAPSIEGTYEESHAVINKLAELGINLKDVTDKLEADGVAAFIKSWDSVLADVQSGIDRVNA